MRRKCKECGKVKTPILTIGGLVCRNCHVIMFYPGTQEYTDFLEKIKAKIQRLDFIKETRKW